MLVACEVNNSKSSDFFASTPPLEAKKLLFSDYASRRFAPNGDPLQLSFVDVKKAYFNAVPVRNIHLQFPRELGAPKGKIARLKRCVYGTRDAGLLWEDTYASCLEAMGFIRGTANPCCFHHPGRDLRLVVHGDDFTTLGRHEDLVWYETELAKSFEIKVRGHLGEGKDCVDEMKILNRVVRLSKEGLLYEADPRHAEMLTRARADNTNTVATPGDKSIEVDLDAELHDPELVTMQKAHEAALDEEDPVIFQVRIRAVHFEEHATSVEVPAYSTIFDVHPRSFVFRADGTKKPLSCTANPFTGKTSRVMQGRLDRHLPEHRRLAAAARRATILQQFAEAGNPWEFHEPIFSVRTPSARKKWEKKSRQGARKVRKLELAEGAGHELSPEDATPFRAMAARANYMAQDRPDCSFVSKELCRESAVPTKHSFERLTRLCRYLLGVRRLVFHYPWQPKQGQLNIWVATVLQDVRQSGEVRAVA